MSFTKTLPFLALILTIISTFTSTHAANFAITNRCSYTVWAAATTGGRRLEPGQTWSVNYLNSDAKRVWGRTGCNFDSNGRGSCQTGDCGGLLMCNPSVSPRSPVTLAEFNLRGDIYNDYYDISVIDGYNVGMSFAPTNGACKSLRCTSPSCPDAYLFPSDDRKLDSCPTGTNYRIVFCP